jgi:two-component system LytT family response regulator
MDTERWANVIASARPPGSPWPERLAVRATGRAVIIELSEVRWIEAAGNYSRLHLPSASHLTRRTMRQLEATLDPARFVRIHRSQIVNLAHVRELRPLGDGDLAVVLAGGRELVATRTYRRELEARFGGVA